MKTTVFGRMGLVALFAVLSLVSNTYADGYCGENINYGCAPQTCKPSLWNYGGHVEAGIFGNEYGQNNAYLPNNGGFETSSGNTDLLLNVRQSDAQLNQAYYYVEKRLNPCRFDVGGRASVMYGTDARYFQTVGLENSATDHHRWNSGDYYTAIPELYGTVGYRNLYLEIGKFASPVGDDSALSPDRFFYSLAPTFAVAPVSLSGVVAHWEANHRLSVFGGWSNGQRENHDGLGGEDNFFSDADNNALLAGFDYKINRCVSLNYAFLYGQDNDYGDPTWGDRTYFVNSLGIHAKLGCRWDYGFTWVYRDEDDDISGWGSYGINQELIYRLNPCWAFGGRFTWTHTHTVISEKADLYTFSLGANWTPCRNLLIRPELRYDMSDSDFGFGPFNAFDGPAHDNQLSFGVSAVVKF